MNKLKNIGISALAGTLVSLSAAQAGGVSVSGTYELSYTQLDHEKVTGNPLGVKKNISFGALIVRLTTPLEAETAPTSDIPVPKP